MAGASEKWRDRQGPECRASGRQLAVGRDHFPLKVRRQSESAAGSLAARRPIVRGLARRDRVFGVWERVASTNFKVFAAAGLSPPSHFT